MRGNYVKGETMTRKFTMRSAVNTLQKALILSLVAFLGAVPLFGVDGEQLLREVDRNLNPESFESYRKIINIEPGGRRKEYTLFTVKKGTDRMAALFLSPASDKGRTTLRLGDNMWLFIPNVGKPIRITSLQSVIGGVFNNADIMRLDYSAEYTVEAVEETDEEYLLRLKARTRSVAYDRLNLWADKTGKYPLKIECLTEKGMLIKTLYFKEVKDFGGGIVRPSVIETDSPLYQGYTSIMIYGSIQERTFKDEVFTLDFMSKIDSLRR